MGVMAQGERIQKFRDHSAAIAVVGLGYVGLPLARLFCEKNFRVIGLDVDPAKIDVLINGQTYIRHVDSKPFQEWHQQGVFVPSSDFSRAAEADAIILCVPTPLDEHREPDLSYVIGSVETLLPHLRAGQVLCLESTTYPGTTHEEILPRIQRAGFTVGENFFLVYSPEREDPNNAQYNTKNIPKICGGETPACQAAGQALYEQAQVVVDARGRYISPS